MRAVKDLNYTPNPAARSLAAAQGTRIGLIYTNPSACISSELLVGALEVRAAVRRNSCWTPGQTSLLPPKSAAARKLAGSVAGVILPPPLCESKPFLPSSSPQGCRSSRSHQDAFRPIFVRAHR